MALLASLAVPHSSVAKSALTVDLPYVLREHVHRGQPAAAVAEGVEARVPYKGKLTDVVFQLLGGLRSGMGYVGAHSLAELRAGASFVRITPGGLRESHAHDIVITEEPINYQSI